MTTVKNLFKSYFLPNNILPRRLGNSIYSGEELCELLIDFANSVNTGKAPLAESYLQVRMCSLDINLIYFCKIVLWFDRLHFVER